MPLGASAAGIAVLMQE